jgi:hypothetical protein
MVLLLTITTVSGYARKCKTKIKFGKIGIENLEMDMYPLDMS